MMNSKIINLILLLFFSSGTLCLAESLDGDFKMTVPFGPNFDYLDIAVGRVVSGDTLQLKSGERVKLIGLEVPRGKIGDKEAAVLAQAYLTELIEDKNIRLEFDFDRKDQHQRLLGYVFVDFPPNPDFSPDEEHHYLSKDNILSLFVNATMIRAGYAWPSDAPQNVRYKELFGRLYREAKESQRGVWGDNKSP